jgi:hypothetical protein
LGRADHGFISSFSSQTPTLMLLDLPPRTSPILRTSSMRLATFYSPKCLEVIFSEVHFHDPAYPRNRTGANSAFRSPPVPLTMHLAARLDRYAPFWIL